MATRIYLPSSGTPAISNATFATWTETTGADRLSASTSRGSTAMTNKTQARTASAANSTWLDRQFVVGPLAAQTFGASTVKGTIRALESAANDNVDAMRLSIRIVAPDGTTFRGTVYGPSNSTVAEFNTSLRAKRLATGGATTSVTATEGDYLIIEVGATATTGGVSISTSINYGDNSATDLGDNETDTAANNPFIEFAANMKFLERGWGQANASIKTVNSVVAQAQASLAFRSFRSAQAQAKLKGTSQTMAQAAVTVDTGVHVLNETFSSVVSNGLGANWTDIPAWYGIGGSIADFSADGTQGFIAAATQFSVRGIYQNTVTPTRNYYIKGQFKVSAKPASNTTQIEVSSLSNIINTSDTTNIGIYIEIGSTTIKIYPMINNNIVFSYTLSSYSINTYYNFLYQYTFTNASSFSNARVRAKIWDAAGNEPDGWQIENSGTSSGGAGGSPDVGPIVVIVRNSSPTSTIVGVDNLEGGPAGWTLYGQAQASIANRRSVTAQAQADIKAINRGWGQAKAQIIVEPINNQFVVRQVVAKSIEGLTSSPLVIGFKPLLADSIVLIMATLDGVNITDIVGTGFNVTPLDTRTSLSIASETWATTTTTDGSSGTQISISYNDTSPIGMNIVIYEITNANKKNLGAFSQEFSTNTGTLATPSADETSADFTEFPVRLNLMFASFIIDDTDVTNNPYGESNLEEPLVVAYEAYDINVTDSRFDYVANPISDSTFISVPITIVRNNLANARWMGAIAFVQQRPLQWANAQAFIYTNPTYVEDHASVDATGGWGNPDTIGPAWTNPSGASDFSKAGGIAFVSVPSATTRVVRNSLGGTYTELKSTGRINIPDLTGSALVAYSRHFLRNFNSNENDAYEFRIGFNASGAIQLALMRRVAGTPTTLVGNTTAFSGYTITDFVQYRIETQTTSAGVSLRFKAWKDGTAEPSTWTIDFNDTDGARIATGGPYTITSQVLAGFTGSFPLVFSYDDLIVQKFVPIGTGQAQAKIGGSGTVTQSAQAQTNIKITSNVFAQSQTDIKAISRAFAQTQVDIKAVSFGLAQAQSDIKQTYFGLAQTQADIKATGRGLGQSQADIKAISRGLAQAQLDIKAIGRGYAQAQADIKQINRGVAQTQADIKVTTSGLGQAQVSVKAISAQVAQVQANIRIVDRGLGQTQARVNSGGALVWLRDTFTRSLTDTLGSPDVGPVYQSTDFQDTFSIDGSKLIVKVTNTPNNYSFISTDVPTSIDRYDIFVDFRLPSGLGAADFLEILFTSFTTTINEAEITGNDTDGYELRISGASEATTSVIISKDITYRLKIRFDSTYISIKVWNISLAEPNWQLSIPTSVAPANTPNIISTYIEIDNYEVDSPELWLDNLNITEVVDTGFGQAQTNIKATSFGLGQSQTYIKQTYRGCAQAQANIKQIGYGSGQANSDIKQIGYGSGQAQTDIKATSTSSGQSQSDIKTTYFGSGQSQADIRATYYGFGQTQACVKGNAYGQAQVDIQQIYYGSAQAQTSIKTTYYGLGQANTSLLGASQVVAQAQADILSAGIAQGQSQADIKQTYQQYGQTQAWIKTTYYGCGQAQVCIKGNAFGQTQADIKQTYVVNAQAQADIKAISRGYGQAQTRTKRTFRGLAQTQARIKQIYRGLAQTQVDIKQTYYGLGQTQVCVTGNAFAQAQGYTKVTDINAYGQSQADIKATSYGLSQAQTYIKTTNVNASGQAQADIKAVSSECGNAQANIKATSTSSGQSQVDIQTIYYGLGQAQTDVLAVSYGSANAQIDILATSAASGNAQADISTTYQSVGQAQGTVLAVSFGYSQAQADITTVYRGAGQAQAYLRSFNQTACGQAQVNIRFNGNAASGQAQAKINAFDQTNSGQSQVDIKSTYQGYGQSQADIKATGFGLANTQADIKRTFTISAQANAEIKQTYTVSGQANTYIKITGISNAAQAQADIKVTSTASGQANSYIKTIRYGHGQAQVYILSGNILNYAQAQVDIKTTATKSGQTNAAIRRQEFGEGQAQTWIKIISRGYGQAQAAIRVVVVGQAQTDIKQTYRGYGNAQALIRTKVIVVAQAQALITTANTVHGQAQALITSGSFGIGLTQVFIVITDIAATGQSQAFIIKAAGFGQAAAIIYQTHTLNDLEISDNLFTLLVSDRLIEGEEESVVESVLSISDRLFSLTLRDREPMTLTLRDREYI